MAAIMCLRKSWVDQRRDQRAKRLSKQQPFLLHSLGEHVLASLTGRKGHGRTSLGSPSDNFRMNTRSGRYGAAYNMVALLCFNEELSLLPKNPTEAKLQATSTRGESTEPT
jgi:hypothetical protein